MTWRWAFFCLAFLAVFGAFVVGARGKYRYGYCIGVVSGAIAGVSLASAWGVR